MIIWKNGDVTLEKSEWGQYAIFERVKYSSGTTKFWQQKTKWYWRKGYCERVWEKMLESDPVYAQNRQNSK